MFWKTERLKVSFLVAITSAMLTTLILSNAFAREDVTTTSIKISGHFKASSQDKARGISGMACLGNSADASRDCFVVNDEERFVEVATLTSAGLTATGKAIDLVKKGETGEGILGVVRDPMCKDKNGVVKTDKFDEFDGEGVAIRDDTVYVVGSHSCSGGGKYKPSSFLLARFKPGNPTSSEIVERSWRLADALLATELGSAYGMPKGEGTNVEGVAVLGGRLYVGLRTPVRQELSFIVSAPIADLFAPGFEGLTPAVVETIPVKLGTNSGIRDLAALDDGRLLILSGPTVEQDEVEYKLWLLERPTVDTTKKFLATVTTSTRGKDGKRAKAETIAVLEQAADRLKLLVLYDNIDEGEPTLYEIRLPPR